MQLLQVIRRLHLYLGIFTAPAILFFAVTGALQTAQLHQTTKGSSYTPAKWILVLAQIHKKQTLLVPEEKLQPIPSMPNSSPDTHKHAQIQSKTAFADTHSVPLKVFVLLVSAGLIVSTFSGLYMSFKYCRNRVVLTVLLIAGVAVPVLLAAS